MTPPSKSPRSGALNSSNKKRVASNSHAAKSAAAEAALLREKEDRQARIVASTFANMELVMTQRTADSINTLYRESLEEIARLRNEMEIRDRDALEVVHFLQTDASEKASQITSLESKLLKAETYHAENENKMTSRYEKIIEEKDELINEIKSEVRRLTCELDNVAVFRREKVEMQMELQECHEREKALIDNYEQELSRAKFDSVEEKVRLRALEDDMNARFKEEINQRALHIAKLKNSHVHDLNQQLTIDKGILEQEVSDLVKSATNYQKRLSDLRVEIRVNEDIHMEALKRTSMLLRKIKEAQSEKRKLNDENQQLLSETQMILKAQEDTAAHKIDVLQKQLADSRNTIMLQQKELIKMKHLAAFILDQRGEMEQFFYKAIQHTKNMQLCEGTRSIENSRDPTFLTQNEHDIMSSVVKVTPRPTMARLTGSSQQIMGRYLKQFRMAGSGGSQSLTTPRTAAKKLSVQETLLSCKQNSDTIIPPSTDPASDGTPGGRLFPRDLVTEQRENSGRKKYDKLLADAAIRANYGAALELRNMNCNSIRHNLQLQPQHRTICRSSSKRDEEYLTCTDGRSPVTTQTVDMESPLAAGEAFSSLPWDQKEQVIKALLVYINRDFYAQKIICNNNHMTEQEQRHAVNEDIDWGKEAREPIVLHSTVTLSGDSVINTNTNTNNVRVSSVMINAPISSSYPEGLTPHLPPLDSFVVRPTRGYHSGGKISGRRKITTRTADEKSASTMSPKASAMSPDCTIASDAKEHDDKSNSNRQVTTTVSSSGRSPDDVPLTCKSTTSSTGSSIARELSERPFDAHKKDLESQRYSKDNVDGRWRRGSPKSAV